MEIKALPIKGMDLSRITGGAAYGMRLHPVLKVKKMHDGIDYAASSGTPVYAVGDGAVVVSKIQDNKKGYGNYVVVDHKGSYSLYAHLQTRSVKVGQTVKPGQQIGTVGSTGDSTGPHLHLGISKGMLSKWVDPLPLLRVFAASKVTKGENDLTKEETLELIKSALAGKDTTVSSWAKPEWEKGKQNGITDGTNPGGYCTREQVVAMIQRANK